MKKHLIGFIFLTILTSLIGINKISALTLNNGDVVPDIESNIGSSASFIVFYSKQYQNYVLVHFQEKYIKTVNGIDNSYVQDNPTGNQFGKVYHNSLGGWCGSSNEPKVWFYYLEDNEWKYKGYDCYGSDIPFIYEYDETIDHTSGPDSYFTNETVNTDFVKEYYRTYIGYSSVNIFKHFYDGKFETPQLIYSTDMNDLNIPPDVSIDGYKMITVPDGARYVFLSNVSNGSIYWLTTLEQIYSPQVFYVDPALSVQPTSYYIDGKNVDFTVDPSLVSQKFDLSNFSGVKLIGIDIYGQDFDGEETGPFYFWVPEDAYVDFSYLYDTSDGEQTFYYNYIDPETGEVVKVENVIYDDIVSERSFFRNFTNALNYFKDSIIGIFQNVTYLFTNLPISLQYFFIFIFTIILFIFLIRFIL